MRPYLDKSSPAAWSAARAWSDAVQLQAGEAGLTDHETELIKLRASQLNGCAYCLDLHARQARDAGVPPQKIDLLPAWRETSRYTEREEAVLAIAEAATTLPLTDESHAELIGARALLGDTLFAAAEWVAVAINTFNRISILSEHPVRARDADGALIR